MADEAPTTPADTTPTEPAATVPDKKTNHLLDTAADSPDPDEVEMNAALAEVAEEEKAKAAGTPETPAAEPAPAAAAAPVPASDAPTTVPVAAVQEERAKRQAAEELVRKSTANALYWKGVADGRFPDPRIKGDVPSEPSPADQSAKAIKDKMSELADQVDAGTLSVKEYETQRQGLDDQLADLREASTLAKVKQSMPSASNDLYLQTLTHDLENQYAGWLANMPNDEIDLMIPFAKKYLAETGIDLPAIAGTPLGDYQLRKAIVEKAKEFGLDKKYGAGASAAPAPSTAPTVKPTAAQLKEKTDLAAFAPPAPSGTTAPANSWTSERIDAIDPLDLENMPMSELKKIGDQLDRNVAATRVPTTTRR